MPSRRPHRTPGEDRNNLDARFRITEPGGSGLWRGPNLLVDGYCEDVGVAAWAVAGVVATKQIATPYQGVRYLRTVNTIASGRVQQNVMTIGRDYRITGVASGDGVALPWVYNVAATPAALVWAGGVAAVWQPFDEIFTAGDAGLRFYTAGGIGQRCEWDYMYLSEE